jgi:hypothetical protein
VAAVAVQPRQVLDGEGAAVGDQQRPRGQEPLVEQPLGLLADGRVVVVVAVQALAEDRQGAEVIDGRGQADVDELLVGGVAVRDVGWWDVAAGPGRPGSVAGVTGLYRKC